MKIEIRNLKFSAFVDKEANGFEATVYIDGKLAGTARNPGHGAPTQIEPSECEARLDAYAAANLPRVVSTHEHPTDPSGFYTFAPCARSLLDDLIDEALLAQDLKKALVKRILFTSVGRPGIYQSTALTAVQITRALARPGLAQMLKADKILNLLPREEALAVYKAKLEEADS